MLKINIAQDCISVVGIGSAYPVFVFGKTQLTGKKIIYSNFIDRH